MKPCAITEDDLDKIKYPVIVQPKIDGIRCLVLDGQALTYSLKPIPNKYTREYLERTVGKFNLDGELILIEGNFQDIQSAFMSREGEPNFIYFVFDAVQGNDYETRFVNASYEKILQIYHCEYILAKSKLEVLLWESMYVNKLGHEGIILRSPHGLYKYGRSTLKEGYLLKLKRFVDAEAVILEKYSLEINTNFLGENEHGLSKRSSHKAGKVSADMLGGLVVRGINGTYKDKQFNVGSGFTEKQRIDIWNQKLTNKIIKYKYQSVGSTTEKPRMPIFLGFRDEKDL